MDERCVHDMVAGTCGICLKVPEVDEPDLGVVRDDRDPDSRYFVAQFRGWCTHGDAIEPGDVIRRAWDDKGTPWNARYIHEECP